MTGPIPPGPIAIWLAPIADPTAPMAFLAGRVVLPTGPIPSVFKTDRDQFEDDEKMLGFHIIGYCPRCNHLTSGLCATKFLGPGDRETRNGLVGSMFEDRPTAGILPTAPVIAAAPTKTIDTVQKCACGQAHTGRPDGAVGCGAEWMLKITYEAASGSLNTVIEALDAETAITEWAGAAAADAAIPTSLTTQQAAADKWQTGLTAIVALAGAGAFFGGTDTIQALPKPANYIFGFAFAAAVVSNIGMLWEGDLASIGFMKLRKGARTSEVGLSEFQHADLLPLEATARSVRKLGRSFGWMKATVVFSVIALGIFLFVSPDASRPTYKVTEWTTTNHGEKDPTVTTNCGTLDGDDPKAADTPDPRQTAKTKDTFQLQLSGGKKLTIMKTDVQTIDACS